MQCQPISFMYEATVARWQPDKKQSKKTIWVESWLQQSMILINFNRARIWLQATLGSETREYVVKWT